MHSDHGKKVDLFTRRLYVSFHFQEQFLFYLQFTDVIGISMFIVIQVHHVLIQASTQLLQDHVTCLEEKITLTNANTGVQCQVHGPVFEYLPVSN